MKRNVMMVGPLFAILTTAAIGFSHGCKSSSASQGETGTSSAGPTGAGGATTAASSSSGGPGGGGGGTVKSVTMTTFVGDTQANLRFVAFKDGDGNWQAASGLGGTYKFNLVGPKYGLAYLCRHTQENDTYYTSEMSVTYAHIDDGVPNKLGCFSEKLHKISGAVKGFPGTNWQGTARRGPDGGSISFNAGNSDFKMLTREGALDLVAANYNYNTKQQTFLRKDALAVFQDSSNYDLDFAGRAAPMTINPSYPNKVPGEKYCSSDCGLWTTGGTLFYGLGDGQGEHCYSAGMKGSDLLVIQGRCYYDSTKNSFEQWVYQTNPSDVAFELPKFTLSPIIQVLSKTPVVQMSADVAAIADAASYSFSTWFNGFPKTDSQWTITATGKWAGGSQTVHFETPDLTKLSGWNDELGLSATAAEIKWGVTVLQTNRPVATLLPRWPNAPTSDYVGKSDKLVSTYGSVIP